ncbi:hypothetical protein E5288_WYG009099 [Bos mutus]|uniref:Uncharacterized protein n=1 Tax=Bos mutus TaxID=72004 RepID=A0A6B0QU88_9CETA|nr:hypothetical protein [Bos mutus]
MIAGQVSKPLLSVRSEMNAELRGEDKAATSDSELNEPLLAPVESNDSEDTPSKLFGRSDAMQSDSFHFRLAHYQLLYQTTRIYIFICTLELTRIAMKTEFGLAESGVGAVNIDYNVQPDKLYVVALTNQNTGDNLFETNE